MTEPSGESTDKPRRPVVVPAVALVAFTGVGITALLGGLGQAPELPEPQKQGVVVDQGRYSTEFVEARVTVEPAKTDFEEDKRFVEMVFDVTNQGDDTASIGMPPETFEKAFTGTSFAGSLVRITPAFGKDAGPFTFGLAKDGETRQLHPGVATKVIVRYQLKDTDQPPKEITLDVASFEQSPSFLSGISEWRMVSDEKNDKVLPEVTARVTLPVQGGDGA
ncbi:hypothetical protein SAMN05444920_116153 [Nonomuraea solani]|uniref:Uncharacterized protein n=1 Tax=Nonomuraea solani TaxID=1144553 RepID=A0A1H6ERD2_9ACTN|nr:hypothetical protein [Nonomuraea solani]SEH00418.1 hypothetical protein SAMN05444920_116153 [Nonomuraea solani]